MEPISHFTIALIVLHSRFFRVFYRPEPISHFLMVLVYNFRGFHFRGGFRERIMRESVGPTVYGT